MLKQSRLRIFLYKACPRCRGDLVLDANVEDNAIIDDRAEYVCLQCGRRTSIEVSEAIRTPAASRAA